MRRLAALPLLGLLFAPPLAAQTPSVTFAPSFPEVDGQFGYSVSGVPDLTGDSRDDALVGMPDADLGAANAGGVYVYSGATGFQIQILASPNPEAAGRFGTAVAGIPDTDGDGRGEILVGAPYENFGSTDAGRAYRYSGATRVLIGSFRSPNFSPSGYFGFSVSGIPDVDGDGRGDLLIGAHNESGGTGRAYLYSGATGGLLRTLSSPNAEAGGLFGYSVSGVPDADGDGRGDLLVGAYNEDNLSSNEGRAYLFSGATGVLLATIVSPAGFESGFLGYSVSGVPDADGDGRGDLLVGEYSVDSGATGSGHAHLYSGASGGFLRTLTSPNVEANGHFGFSVSGVPDANGDGRGDLLVGAPQEDGGATDAGRAYLFSGATGGLIRTVTSATPETAGNFGASVSGSADTNFDGRGDLFAGARREDGGAADGGRAYLFRSDTRPVSLAGPQGWRLLATPLTSSPADLLAEAWTQGAVGADASDGDPNVYGYAEAVAGLRGIGYTPLPDLRTADVAGQGRAVYVFADDDLIAPGTQGGFPKALAVSGHTRAGYPVAFPVSFTPSGSLQEDGWNLVGNPYDLNLDWDVAGWTKTNFDNTIYVFNRALGVYQTWNGTAGSLGDGVVAEFQGFWVKASAPAPLLVAPAAARVATPPPTTPLGPSLGLRLAGTLGGQPVEDAAFVSFVPGAADALDPFDAYELAPFSDTFAALYTEGPGALLDVEARAPLGGAAVFTLSATAVASGQAAGGALTLSWPDLAGVPAAWRLTLTDVATGATVDLRQQPSYPFTLAAGLAPESVPSASIMTPPVPTPLAFADGLAPPARFLLRIEDAAVAGEGSPGGALSVAAGPNPTSGPTRLAFTLPAPASVRLSVFDALGREVARLADGERAAGAHDAILDAGRLAPGVYVVRLTSGASAVVQRLTVVR